MAALGQATTIQELTKRLRRLPADLDRSLVRAVVVSQEAGRVEAVNELTQRGIGRSLWGWAPKSARRRMRKPRVWVPAAPRVEDGQILGIIGAYGIAAMVELGGQTRPHEINTMKGLKRNRGGVLAFRSRSGAQVFARRVHHPGGSIPSRPYLEVGQEVMVQRFHVSAEREMQFALDHAIG